MVRLLLKGGVGYDPVEDESVMAIRSRGWGTTDVGLRERNEDTFVVDNELQFYAVCDGLGGHARGDVASGVAAETALAFVRQQRSLLNEIRGGELPVLAARYLLEDAIQEASTAVFERALSDKELLGMGTTMTLALVVGNHLVMAHVGDSRLYLYRGFELRVLTRDHTISGELEAAGLWTPKRAQASRLSHVLTRCVGASLGWVEVDTRWVELHPGDALLLCSDGLLPGLPDACEVHEVARDEQPCRRLVERALKEGTVDNVTAVWVRLEEEVGTTARVEP